VRGSEQRRRALVVTPDFPPLSGGIQLVMHRLAEGLRGETRVVTLGTQEAPRFDATSRLDVVRVSKKRERNRLATTLVNVAALREGRRFSPDVVISGHAVTAPATLALRRSQGVPALQYVHADEFRSRPRLTALAVRRVDATVAVSQHAKRMAVAAGALPERVRVINPGVDVPGAVANERAQRPTVVTVARLAQPYKGHDLMVEALPRVRDRVPDVEWVVIGDGPLRPELERAVASQGLSEAVRFVGKLGDEERDRWLDRAHVFTMPSRLPPGGVGGEGFGIVYLEAGAHGLPVVGGAVGGALDAIVHEETGLLVDPTDPEAIADAIVTILLDPSLARRLGEAGRGRARRSSWERHVEAVEGLLDELTAVR
jgi:phosphatidylinositol alpha-1,6-mannosyltransferase